MSALAVGGMTLDIWLIAREAISLLLCLALFVVVMADNVQSPRHLFNPWHAPCGTVPEIPHACWRIEVAAWRAAPWPFLRRV